MPPFAQVKKSFMPTLLAGTLLTLLALAQAAQADTLEQIKSTGEIRIGYRESSLPLSWIEKDKPTGFMVSLCEKVINEQIAPALKIKQLKIKYVPVNVQTRFPLLDQKSIDMECGSTTVTLARMKQVDFSLVTYVTTSKLVSLKKIGPMSLDTMSGRTLAVQTGSSHAELISKMIGNAKILYVANATAGVQALADGKAQAYVDGEILYQSAIHKLGLPKDEFVAGSALSVEPFAIVTRKGDTALEKLIDVGLRKIFSHSDEALNLLKGYSDQLGMDINALTRDAIRNPSKGHECSMLETVSC